IIPLPEIAEALERSETATYRRAYELDLPKGCPEGHEWLNNAAERAGVASRTLIRITAWAELPIHKSITPALHRRPRRRRRKPGRPIRCQWRFVSIADVDEAMRRWGETESIRKAARRHHIAPALLSRKLRSIGFKPAGRGKPIRVTEADLRKVGVS